jgi:hypothetical protein
MAPLYDRAPTSRLPADANGGTCSGIIDLANDHPPAIEVAPGLWRMGLPWQPTVIGHCRDMGDPSAPILTDGRQIPPGSPLPVQVCTGCDPAVFVSPGAGLTWLIVEHQPGCGVLAELLAGRPR